MSAIKHIQQKIMDIAKRAHHETRKKVSVKSQMKWDFQYPQHFNTLVQEDGRLHTERISQ